MIKNESGNYDAVLIPGGGVTGEGKLPPWVIRRLEKAVGETRAGVFILLSAGTIHKPPPHDDQGFPIFESQAAADYLIHMGIPSQRILIETCSYDTIGNAYFSRVIHVDPCGFRRLLVVTSSFHVARTETVFRWVYGLEPPAKDYLLDFQKVPDYGLSEKVLRERAAREAASLQKIIALRDQIQTLSQLHHWLFSEHEAYRAGGKPNRIGGPVLESY